MKEKERQIINHYGVIPQLKYMQTEMFELIEAVLTVEHKLVGYVSWLYLEPEDKAHIEEEYADLTMMLEQIKEYYQLSDDNIQKIKEQKIERQLKRIKEEK